MRMRNPTRCSVLLAILFFFGYAIPAFADGGRVRFREPAGPFIVTLFTTPDPLITGRADFSVAVERADVDGIVQDANVDLVLTPIGGSGSPLEVHASHADATSKWLQAANFSLPSSGPWQVTVRIQQGRDSAECSGQVHVETARTRDLTWDILPVPLVAFLLVLHQNRKRNYNRMRKGALASTARSEKQV